MQKLALPAIALLLVSGCTGGDSGSLLPTIPGTSHSEPSPTTDDETDAEFAARMETGLESVFSHMSAMDALEASDWQTALIGIQDARTELGQLYDDFEEGEDRLGSDERTAYRALFLLLPKVFDAFEAEVVWLQQLVELATQLEAAQTEDEAVGALYGLELVLLDVETVADITEDVADAAEVIIALNPELAEAFGLDQTFIDIFQVLADEFRTQAQDLQGVIDEAVQSMGNDYVAPDDRIFFDEPDVAPLPEELVSQTVFDHFRSFDADVDGQLSIPEAREFYYWVEANVPYRYDDEDAQDTSPGDAVGDGRAGNDYQQTPTETFQERTGDCEDMNTLEVAFYNSWGITAYQAYVNAQSQGVYDHAIAIVYAGETVAEAETLVGRIDYYTIEAGNQWNIPSGVYFIVDNAYSDNFGYISGGIGTDQFTLFEVHALGQDLESYVS